MRISTLSLSIASALVAASTAVAQNSLATRVAQAPDGIVRVTFASRPGTCGNGRDMIGYRKALFADNFQSIGDWNAPDCAAGPLRVTITKSDGRVTRVRTSVGGDFARTSERVTDLGMVAPIEASSYFFSIVPQLEHDGSIDKARFLLPAVLANAGDVTPQLTSLARDDSRTIETRRHAIHWLGLLGDARVVPTLVAFAHGSDSNDADSDGRKGGKKGLAETAMMALGSMEDGVGVPALIDLARDRSAGTRRIAVFWLGQSGDPRALAMLHTVIENQQEDDGVRSHAVFSLGQAADKDPSQIRYLQSIYPRATSGMKEQIFLTMSQRDGGSDWLLQKARDTNDSMDTRRKALFWAGQNHDTPTRDLAAFYRSTTDESLKEHAIFVLSQRDDEAALNELMRIAQSDTDRRMRAKAFFWLGQKDDPRVANLIADKISK
ncbi:MAG TPA: HEAT repeat domain-containing protein [Gemmatimonadaceae bacterium]|nr:HEAT repeat domain-containing protein [Gemmatimonadaceae bacterium]